MFRPRFAAAGFALLAAGLALAQLPAARPAALVPTPLAVLVLPGIDDPAVVADLKLTPEQLKTLVARRQARWDEAYSATPTAEATAARTAAADAALKATLTPAQYARATQIGAQRVVFPVGGRPDGGMVLSGGVLPRLTAQMLQRYPELADAYRLTAEQKKQLADAPAGGGSPGFAAITPTPEQMRAATAFLGPILPQWAAKTDPRVAAIPKQPQALELLAAKDVRADAGVSDDQAKAAAALSGRWTKLRADWVSTLTTKDYAAAAAALAADTEKELAAFLTPAQLARVRQIDRQTRPAGGHVERFYTDPAAAKEFDITPSQAKALDAAWAEFRAAVEKALLAGEPTAAAEKRLVELVAARRAKAEAVLTPTQAERVKAAFGAPFTGRTTADRGSVGTQLQDLRAATFGKYAGEAARLARDPAIRAELKLTDEQVKQALALQAEVLKVRLPFGGDPAALAKSYADRSETTAAGLKTILTPAQAKRFHEIMMQSREAGPPGLLPGETSSVMRSAVTYPGAAEAVGLTADQRAKLVAGTDPAAVLTAAQKAALAKRLGEPFAAAARPAFGTSPITLPRSFPVIFATGGPGEAELKLAPDQRKAVDAARAAFQDAVARSRPGTPGDIESAMKQMTGAAAAFDTAVQAVLSPAQKTRLAQVELQTAAAANLAGALTDLDLSADQRARLAALAAEAASLQRLLASHPGADTPDRRLAYRLRDAADERMLAVLTDAQRARWAELTGPPVAGLRKSLTVPFGLDGFGGGVGFGGGPVVLP
ncbi:hypothetical protein [Urbifossiella limnaea]|uniref:LTXXQ motif protein n=1 Tax=Urbifossiella limnaea TaxID=2528023 RepID=A0A517Y1D1_9BACT|nr:hypothetical protein [Urbifossiella limnaea]QDU23533.1 LTXXQ motif protein [Urbifossiella limnaea]